MHGGAGAPALYHAYVPSSLEQQQQQQQQQQELLQAIVDSKYKDALAASGAGEAGGTQAANVTDSVSKYIRGVGDAL